MHASRRTKTRMQKDAEKEQTQAAFRGETQAFGCQDYTQVITQEGLPDSCTSCRHACSSVRLKLTKVSHQPSRVISRVEPGRTRHLQSVLLTLILMRLFQRGDSRMYTTSKRAGRSGKSTAVMSIKHLNWVFTWSRRNLGQQERKWHAGDQMMPSECMMLTSVPDSLCCASFHIRSVAKGVKNVHKISGSLGT
jgi:hypothetical protein